MPGDIWEKTKDAAGFIKEQAEKRPLLFAVVIFFVVRWHVLIFNTGFAVQVMGEERIFSTWALERMRGNPMAELGMFNEFLYGGAWLQSYLYIPIFKIFGCSQLSMKLLPILFSTFGFAAYFLVALKFFGRRSAFWYALAATIGTPIYMQYQLLGMANHSELIAFTGPGFLFIFWMLFGKRHKPAKVAAVAALAGFWVGLGIFYCYSGVAFAYLFAGAWILILLRNLRRYELWNIVFALTTLVGFKIGYGIIDRVWSASGHAFFGYYQTTKGISESMDTLWGMLVNSLTPEWIYQFITGILPRVFCFNNDIVDYGYFFFAIFLILTLVGGFFSGFKPLFRQGERFKGFYDRIFKPESVGAMLLLAYVGMYVVNMSNKKAGIKLVTDQMRSVDLFLFENFHYFLPAFPALFLLIAVGISVFLGRESKARFRGRIVLILMVIFSVACMARVTDRPGAIFGKSCADYTEFVNSNIFAFKVHHLPADQFCQGVEKHAAAMNPEYADTICDAIFNQSPCDCPLESGVTREQVLEKYGKEKPEGMD